MYGYVNNFITYVKLVNTGWLVFPKININVMAKMSNVKNKTFINPGILPTEVGGLKPPHGLLY
jgi:hypothetical protein